MNDQNYLQLMNSFGVAEKGNVSETNNIQSLSAAIWAVANLLRGTYKAAEYRKVILPFTVLRRMDCVLEPTKQKVLEAFGSMDCKSIKDLDPIQLEYLKSEADQFFFNVSTLSFASVTEDTSNLQYQFEDYVRKFSPNVEDIFENFKFFQEIQNLHQHGLLLSVVHAFSKIDLHPSVISNHDMGLLFEELLRRFNEESPGGEQYTPRDAIELMTHLISYPRETPSFMTRRKAYLPHLQFY